MLSQLQGFLWFFLFVFFIRANRQRARPSFLLCVLRFLLSQYQRTDDFQYSFISSVILPCICTVFKEPFVYVFAIKKKMLLKTNILSWNLSGYATSVCWGTRWSNVPTLPEPVKGLRRECQETGLVFVFPEALFFFPFAFIFFLPLSRQLVAAGGEAVGELEGGREEGEGGRGALDTASAEERLKRAGVWFNKRYLRDKESGLNRSCFDEISVGEGKKRPMHTISCKTGLEDELWAQCKSMMLWEKPHTSNSLYSHIHAPEVPWSPRPEDILDVHKLTESNTIQLNNKYQLSTVYCVNLETMSKVKQNGSLKTT